MKKQCRVFIFFITLLIFIFPFSGFTLTTINHHIDSLHPDAHYPGPPQSYLKPSSISPLEHNTKLFKPSVSNKNTSYLKNHRLSVDNSLSNTAENTEPVCDLQGFANKQGSALAEHILSMSISCLERLHSDAEPSIRIRAFRTQNMLSIAEVTEQHAHSYNGTDVLLGHYYLYLRAGYHNYRYYREDIDWSSDKKAQIDQAVILALTAFMENPHFYDINPEHSIVLEEALITTDKAELQAHFLPFYKEYLKQFNQNYIDQEYIDYVVNRIFIALHQGHLHSETFRQAVTEDSELIRILRDFALSDWMLGTSVEWLAGNAALELARFLQYDEVSIYPEVVSAVQDIFNRYDFFSGPGFEISVWVLKNVLRFEKCEEFQVCGVKEQLIAHVFSRGQYLCHQVDIVIQSQDLTEEQLMNTCEILAAQEMYFHEKLMTHRIPVENDFNETLEVVVFSNAHNYRLYSDLFFGNSTNNGGVYLEGNSSYPAQCIIYISNWQVTIQSLKHEYVHHLDGRYNLYGTFTSVINSAGGAVITWWSEGLAEYISDKDDNPGAFALLFESSQTPALSQVFKTTYLNSIDFIYRWSYFAVRFMFEEHLEEVTRLLQYFRAGQYDEYAEYLHTSIGSKYDAEFSEWLEGLKNKSIQVQPLNVPEYIPNNRNFRRIDLSSYFSSTQDLSFSVTSSNPSVLQAEIVEGKFLILKPRLPGVAAITITAQSSYSSTQMNMTITVVPSIRIFEPQFNEPLSIFEKTRTIDLSKYVEGPSKEDIIFTVESLDPDIASVHLAGSLLMITALKAGTAFIEFRATYEDNSIGIGSWYTFRVDIVDGESIAGGYCYNEPVDNQQGYIAEMSLASRRIADYRNKVYSLDDDNDIVVFTDSSYTLNITAGTVSSTNEERTNRVEAWMDWNEDKVFSNETEKVMDEQVILSNTNVFKKVSSVFTVPPETKINSYKRLRVRISDTQRDYPSACSDYESGEIEDHLVWVYPGPADVLVNNIDGEKQSVLKIKTSIKEIPLSEMFYTHDNSVLTYSAVSSDPNQAEVQIENNKLIIRKTSSAENFEPVRVTVRAEIPATGQTAEKEFSVVFELYTLPLVLSAGDERRESFVRVINNSDQEGVVHITGRDDSGRVKGPISLSLKAGGSAHFNSGDLENGNTNKGLTSSLGSGQGNWRLTLTSDLEFHASSYIRLKGEGFVTSMNELVNFERNGESYNYFVPIFNPASNQRQRSLLKLFNPNGSEASVVITGIDDQGNESSVNLNLSAQSLKTLTAQDLENGTEGLSNTLGNGAGKWRLNISSTQALDVMNLMESPTGHLSNLSYSSLSSANTDTNLHKTLLPGREDRHGFIRIINHSNTDGEIALEATDDLSRYYDYIQLSISAGEVIHFNSHDLQNGNESKGLPYRGLGSPQGMWRLQFETDLDISVLSYMRSSDGFLTSLDSVQPVGGKQYVRIYDDNRYSVRLFNPGSNQNQRSLLRFINTNYEPVFVSIRGVDDKGRASEEVFFTVPAESTKTLSAEDLETGRAEGLRGSLGDGAGKWHLRITSGQPLSIMNLMESPNGYISNLSIP